MESNNATNETKGAQAMTKRPYVVGLRSDKNEAAVVTCIVRQTLCMEALSAEGFKTAIVKATSVSDAIERATKAYA